MALRPTTRARILAGIAAVAGVALLARREWGIAAGLLSIAAALGFLVTERDLSTDVAGHLVESDQRALARLAAALHLRGNGIVLPAAAKDGASLLFLPAEDASLAELPLDVTNVVQREGAALGVVVPAPGSALETAWIRERGAPQGAGAEEAAVHLKAALPHFGLGRDVTVARSDTLVRVSYEPLALGEACQETREALAPWHVQAGCPTCSFCALVVARAYGGPARFHAAGAEGARVYLDLEVGARSRA